jgi:prevent-host-death family protein
MAGMESPMGKKITATEFKTHCLRIFDEVESSGKPVTITKRGRPVAEVSPVKAAKPRSIIGCMKGSVTRLADDPADSV